LNFFTIQSITECVNKVNQAQELLIREV